MKLPRRKVWSLAGEAQVNDDGTPRQRILAEIDPGTALSLQRQPDNPFDPNAIAVLAGNHQIGFIARTDATEIAPLLDAGIPHRAQLHELTGGMPGYPNFGAKICIAWRDNKMLAPQPLSPEQSRHQSARSLPRRSADNRPRSASGPAIGPAIGIAVAFVVACIMVAALL